MNDLTCLVLRRVSNVLRLVLAPPLSMCKSRMRAGGVNVLLAVTFLCWRPARGVCESVEVAAGSLFSCELTQNDFFNSTGNEVEYLVALAGRPGLPSWLNILQVDSSSPGYIYGTPEATDEGGITLEITAMDQLSFDTERKMVEVSVVPVNGEILLMAELFLANYNTDELLTPVVLQMFEDVLKQVFGGLPGATPGITHVLHPTTRGVPAPPPPAKHGVIVVITPGLNVQAYSTAPVEAARAVQGQCSGEEQFELPPDMFELFLQSGFEIDWCKFQVELRSEGEEEALQDVGVASDDSFVSRPSTLDGSVAPLVAVVVVCGVILFITVIVLSCVLFGGRKQAFYVPPQKRLKKAAVTRHARETASGPKAAQRYLRDLAQVPRRRPAAGRPEDEELVLANGRVAGGDTAEELHEAIGRGGHAPEQRQRDPPPYTYPQGLTRQPLQADTALDLPEPPSYI